MRSKDALILLHQPLAALENVFGNQNLTNHTKIVVNYAVVVVVVDPTPPTCCQQSPAPEIMWQPAVSPPGVKERLHFVGIRPEVQARKGGW